MNKPIKYFVEGEKTFTLVWHLGDICNYNCSYCINKRSSDIKKYFPKLNSFTNFIKKFREYYPNRKVEITLVGGEPTLWKYFKRFLLLCKEYNISICLISNGSRSIKWWKNVINNIDFMIISYHLEHANKYHIIELMKLAKSNNIRSQINFMASPDNFFDNTNTAKEISKKSKCFILLKIIRNLDTDDPLNYTPKQLDFLQNNRAIGKEYYCWYDHRIKIYNQFEDNSKILYKNVNEVVIKNVNQWKGWKCTAGLDMLVISFDGSLHACNQTEMENGNFGNINTEFKIPTESVICTLDKCSCTQDILVCNKEV